MSVEFKFKEDKLLIYVNRRLAKEVDCNENSEIAYTVDPLDSYFTINHLDELSTKDFPESVEIETSYESNAFDSIKWLKLKKKDEKLYVTAFIEFFNKDWSNSFTIRDFVNKFKSKSKEYRFHESKKESSLSVEITFILKAGSLIINIEKQLSELKSIYEATELEFSGIVYVLTNPAMPGIVKIGKTSRNSVDARLKELYSTGVPVPFECAFAGRVNDEGKTEKAFHLAFGPYRLNPKREFFQIEPEQAIALLDLMIIEDVTPNLQAEADKVDTGAKAGADKLKARRPIQNFLEMGIPEGSTLHFTQSEDTCTVLNGRRVSFNGENISLTALTKKLLNTERPLQPSPYWLFDGRKLTDIYNETYE